MISSLDRLQPNCTKPTPTFTANFIDPLERFCDDGEHWLPLGGDGDALSSLNGAGTLFGGPSPSLSLRDIRNQCRLLAATNEFAINGHENRISFIVGPGHTYRATAKNGHTRQGEARARADAEPNGSFATLAAAVQPELDLFIRDNRWHASPARDRPPPRPRWRSLPPLLHARRRLASRPLRRARPGRHAARARRRPRRAPRHPVTDRHDVESVLGYYIDGQLVDAADIQHRKANVDANVRRGLPLFYPVRKNLRRAEKLLRNMSVVAEIQSAIALIRKHRHGTRSALQQFVADRADATATSHATGRTTYYKHYGPGTILDTHADVEYDFPAAGLDAGAYVTVLQAELRAIASRLVMPEFMLTSDASNANYSSDDDRRRPGHADVRPPAGRASRRRPGSDVARRPRRRRRRPSPARGPHRDRNPSHAAVASRPRPARRSPTLPHRVPQRHPLPANLVPAQRASTTTRSKRTSPRTAPSRIRRRCSFARHGDKRRGDKETGRINPEGVQLQSPG